MVRISMMRECRLPHCCTPPQTRKPHLTPPIHPSCPSPKHTWYRYSTSLRQMHKPLPLFFSYILPPSYRRHKHSDAYPFITRTFFLLRTLAKTVIRPLRLHRNTLHTLSSSRPLDLVWNPCSTSTAECAVQLQPHSARSCAANSRGSDADESAGD